MSDERTTAGNGTRIYSEAWWLDRAKEMDAEALDHRAAGRLQAATTMERRADRMRAWALEAEA